MRSIRSILLLLCAILAPQMAFAATTAQLNPFDVITAALTFKGEAGSSQNFALGQALSIPRKFYFEMPVDGRSPIVVTVEPSKFMARTAERLKKYIDDNNLACDFYDHSFSLCYGDTGPAPGPDGIRKIGWDQFYWCLDGARVQADYGGVSFAINDNMPCDSPHASLGFDYVNTGIWIPTVGGLSFFYNARYHPNRLKVEDWWNKVPLEYLKALNHGDPSNSGPPSITDLINDYGFAFSEPVTGKWVDADHPATPDPGTGTGTGDTGGSTSPNTATTCKNESGVATTNQYECAPADKTSKCSVLDIPCNFRYFFIPDKDELKAIFSSQNLSKTINFPIQTIDKSRFTICLFDNATQCSDPDHNQSGNTWFEIDWTLYRLPTAMINLISFVFWLGAASYILNFLGLPNPFGRRAAPDNSTGNDSTIAPRPVASETSAQSSFKPYRGSVSGGGFGGRTK